MSEDGPNPTPASAQSSREEPARRLVGAEKLLDEMRYPQLYDHSQRLGRVRDWDGRSEFAGLGLVFLGAGIGGVFAGQSLIGIVFCFALGAALFIASLFIRRSTAESVSSIKEDFDRALSEYEATDSAIKNAREHYDSLKPDAPKNRKEKFQKFFNLGKYA